MKVSPGAHQRRVIGGAERKVGSTTKESEGPDTFQYLAQRDQIVRQNCGVPWAIALWRGLNAALRIEWTSMFPENILLLKKKMSIQVIKELRWSQIRTWATSG